MKARLLYLICLILIPSFFVPYQMPCLAGDLHFPVNFPFYEMRMKKNFRETNNDFFILHSRNVGMFSVFGDVLSLCKNYEAGKFAGFEVNFEELGLYYDQDYGPNWWTYYCEPLLYLREKEGEGIRKHIYRGYPSSQKIVESETSRHEAYSLITKYIHIKESIQCEVDEFVERNFTNYFVIAVHYRGTDKISEAPRVAFQEVKKSILEVMSGHENESVKIFIASDEEPFIAFMKDSFGEMICYNDNVIRSEDNHPIHIKNKSPYESGKDALIDSLLLSRASFLIRTSSNLSLWSTFFNPDIPLLELSQRKYRK